MKMLVAVLAAGGGIYLAHRFLIKPDGPIPMGAGFGLDDVALGAAAVGGVALAHHLLPASMGG